MSYLIIIKKEVHVIKVSTHQLYSFLYRYKKLLPGPVALQNGKIFYQLKIKNYETKKRISHVT